MKVLELKRVRRYEHYDIRDEVGDAEDVPDMEPQLMKRLAYTKTGDWIGSSKEAYRYVHRLGITQFEKAKPEHCVTSIGFSPKDQKWYGWSHRAICGFGIGSEVKEGDSTNSSGWTKEYLEEHPEEDTSLPVGFIAKSLDDAKRMALAFAESVS